MKRILISIVIVFFSIFLFPAFYSITQSQSLDIEKQEVIYELPYPGLLPDHPLYFIKSMRDKFLIFTTRDNQKKARLYLHLSDKHMSASLALVEKGKELLAVGELQKGEYCHALLLPNRGDDQEAIQDMEVDRELLFLQY